MGKIKIVRTKERVGLIKARSIGAINAVGDIVLFLDAHCEANVGWLPPLLERIALDRQTAVCPTIDFIDHNTFEYKPMDPYIRGTFNWRFDYKERPVRAEDMKKRKDPTQEVKYGFIFSIVLVVIIHCIRISRIIKGERVSQSV